MSKTNPEFGKWIPVTGHWEGNKKVFDNPMPDDGQQVIISYKYIDWNGGVHRKVLSTTCILSEKYGYRFYDVAVDSVYAWMPCPKPYKEARHGNE